MGEYATPFMQTKVRYDSLSQAIRLAKQHGCTDDDVKPLIDEKAAQKKVYILACDKLLKSMTLAKNVAHIEENWYGVRYLDDKQDAAIKIEIITKKDVYILERDGRTQRELSRTEMDTLIPGVIDEVGLNLYKMDLHNRAVDLVYEYLRVVIEPVYTAPCETEHIEYDRANLPPTVSQHAARRWIQRVWGQHPSNDVLALEVLRQNRKAVEEEVLDGFGRGQHVWTSDDGIEYYFDDKNIMYVYGTDNTIITLYEEDFGFDKAINRSITFAQVEVMSESYDKFIEAEENHRVLLNNTEGEIMAINDQITLLESQIASLSSRKTTLAATRDESSRGVTVHRNKFFAEYNKLFKKFEV